MPKFKVLLTDYAWSDLGIESCRARGSRRYVNCVVATATDAETLAGLAADVDAIMTNWAKVPEAVIAAAPRCRIISRLGIGLDNIDVACATQRKIVVTNVPDYCLIEVAEHTIAAAWRWLASAAFYHHECQLGRYSLASARSRRSNGSKARRWASWASAISAGVWQKKGWL